jgi:hypothetical protein
VSTLPPPPDHRSVTRTIHLAARLPGCGHRTVSFTALSQTIGQEREQTMKTIRMTMLAGIAALAMVAAAGSALAQGKSQGPQGTPSTSNQVPSECAKMTSPQSKDECVRSYHQKEKDKAAKDKDAADNCASLSNAKAKDDCVRNQKQKASTGAQDSVEKAKGQGQGNVQGAGGQGNKKK